MPRRTALDGVLHDKAFNIAKNPKYDRYQRGLASMVYKIFDRRSNLLTDISALGGSIKNMLKQELANNHTKELLKSWEMSGAFIFKIQSLGRWSCKYAINK